MNAHGYECAIRKKQTAMTGLSVRGLVLPGHMPFPERVPPENLFSGELKSKYQSFRLSETFCPTPAAAGMHRST
jgi:hypothetical protein